MSEHDADDDATTTNPLLDSLRAYVDARVDARLAEHGLLEADGGDGGDSNDSDGDGEQASTWGSGPYGGGPYGED